MADVAALGDEAGVYVLFSPHRFEFSVHTATVGDPVNPVAIPVKVLL